MQLWKNNFSGSLLIILSSFMTLNCASQGALLNSNTPEIQNTVLRKRPSDFVILNEVVPDIRVHLMYLESQNFLGRPVLGYKKNVGLVTLATAKALIQVQKILKTQGFSLLIRDAYRPQKAVNDFIEWSQDLTDNKMKALYYPDIPKNELFDRGYIARRSGHSRGSTLDLTLWDLQKAREVDMGTILDFLGEESHTDWSGATPEQKQNRQLLKKTMESCGFKNYSKEWWHYTLLDEPYPQTYFDFDIDLKE